MSQPIPDALERVTAKSIPNYSGPYIITQIITPSTYGLSISDGKIRRQLKKWAFNPFFQENETALLYSSTHHELTVDVRCINVSICAHAQTVLHIVWVVFNKNSRCFCGIRQNMWRCYTEGQFPRTLREKDREISYNCWTDLWDVPLWLYDLLGLGYSLGPRVTKHNVWRNGNM
jgi:hypothetical protein